MKTCGKCKDEWHEDEIFEDQECLEKSDIGGYGAVIGDGVRWSITLCQVCLHEVFGPYIIIDKKG